MKDPKEQELIDAQAAADCKWNEADRKWDEAECKWTEADRDRAKAYRDRACADLKCDEADRNLREYRISKALERRKVGNEGP